MSYSGRELVDGAIFVITTVNCGSVDISQTIEEQRAIGKTPVRLAPEGINRPEIPLSNTPGRKLENNSASITAAGSSRAIEVAMPQNHPTSRACGSVRAARKSVNHLEVPSSI